MRNLFNLDNPFMQFMGRLGDLMVLSVITLALCLPVVTFGPAVTALFKTVYALTLGTCGSVVSTYFRAFRDNFRQSLIVGIILLVALASFVCDFVLIRMLYTGTAYKALLAAVAVLALLVLCVTAYMFPLIARYNNTLSEHLRNAIILAITSFPRTILSVAVHVLPAALFVYQTMFMLQTMVVWALLGPGIIAQVDSYLLKPVFQKLEKTAEGAEASRKPEEAESEDPV